ncbi:hypothetical protein BIV57_16460 [Mangrovactinospora gilvigrisea]|uniref:SAV-6107-like HEPN domain-containing protein n=1 Tax=Mangrovactinospora gilvigrisea TaxID=1428644 RepID=A0A1J7C4B1_9ACTN|nr:SAV_6107 family HEPN domain-containing protein [Mangrovactinospora gilvigrisea]OIV36412.1 hypothetical protein BIV57_16460 [Mangrovactinospora gilvigrisea]
MSARQSAGGRRPAGAVPGPGAPGDVHPVLRRAAAPPAALGLLDSARRSLDEADEAGATPNERFVAAHLAALRTAAAVLAVRVRPDTVSERRRRKIRPAWEVLPEVAPELAEWAAYFAAGARRRALAEAGVRDAVAQREADDQVRDAKRFLRIVTRLLMLQPTLPEEGSAGSDGSVRGAALLMPRAG